MSLNIYILSIFIFAHLIVSSLSASIRLYPRPSTTYHRHRLLTASSTRSVATAAGPEYADRGHYTTVTATMSDDITFEQRCVSINEHAATAIYYHERVLVQMLEFEDGNELDDFIQRLKKGCIGRQNRPGHVPNPTICGGKVNVDSLEVNGLRLYREKNGSKLGTDDRYDTTDPTPDIGRQEEAFYIFGREKDMFIPLKRQYALLRRATGIERAGIAPSTAQRREELWEACMMHEREGDVYYTEDLPKIAIEFHDVWKTVEVEEEWDTTDMPPDVLSKVRDELVTILKASHVLSFGDENVSIIKRRSKRVSGELPQDTSDEPERRSKRRRWSKRSVSPVPPTGSPMETLAAAAQVTEDSTQYGLVGLTTLRRMYFDEKKYEKVGRLEIIMKGARDKKDRIDVNQTIHEHGGDIVGNEEYEKYTKVEKSILTRYCYNFSYLKKDISEKIPECHPMKLKDEDLLLQWHNQGDRITKGETLPRKLLDRFGHMTNATSVMARHLCYSFNYSLSSLPAMFCAWAPVFTGQALLPEEFPSARTIRNHIEKIDKIDDYRISQLFEKEFKVKKQPYGFIRSHYISTDDTTHGKADDHHVIIRSGDYGPPGDEDLVGFFTYPFFDCLASCSSASKNNQGNAAHNIDSLKAHTASFEVLSMCGGGTVDNAAMAEIKQTHEGLMELISEDRPELTKIYGVDKWCIVHNDPFHCCCLAIQHASEFGFGKTEKGNNRQVHHRQCMQTLHSIVVSDKILAQSLADKILERNSDETSTDPKRRLKYKIRTFRERQQRWLINGRFAKIILEGHNLDLPLDHHGFWVTWAYEYLPLVSGWKRTALEELITWFMMPEIIVGIQFEAELVDYFEVTYQWHAAVGELCKKSGFRTMELHHLLFDHIMPFWEGAMKEPEKRFPLTFKRIEEVDDLAFMTKKKDQVEAGIKAGYDEIKKLYQTLLKAPMIFLATLDPEKGPSILRAILALVEEEEVDINRADGYDDDANGYGIVVDEELEWGTYKYDNPDDRPADEKIWYDWLWEDRAALAHWYQQIGLCRRVVLNDLKKLSQEGQGDVVTTRKSESTCRLRDFFDEYPVLFAAYRAVFALLPSASRIVESAHGIVRYSYDPQVPSKFRNAKMRYKMNTNHTMSEERRVVIRKKRAEAGVKGGKVKDADRKETQAMIGEQILKLVELYSDKSILDLPPEVQKSIIIRNINRANARILEERLKINKTNAADLLRGKRATSREEKSIAEFQEAAKNAVTEHDKNWSLRDARQEMVTIGQMLTKKWWTSIPVSEFFVNLEAVLPSFYSDSVVASNKTTIMKKGSDHDLGAHLAKIVKLSKHEEPSSPDEYDCLTSTLSNEHDLTGMSEEEILRLFVKFDQSPRLSNMATKEQERQTKLEAVFNLFGTDLSTRQRFTSQHTYSASVEDGADDDDDDDDVVDVVDECDADVNMID